jgi:hypothetical protein
MQKKRTAAVSYGVVSLFAWALFRGNRSWLRSCLGSPDGARLAGGSPKAGETDLALSERLFVQVGP